MKKLISTTQAPAAIGPYSQGVEIQGTMIFVSGQLPIDPNTGTFAGDDIVTQCHQSIRNVKAILETAGTDLEHVAKTTVFIKNMNDFSALNEVYAQYFSNGLPARSAVEVACLPKGALVEIEAIAIK